MNIKRTTVDFFIRQSWHKIQRMYNQKAQGSDISISIGYILLMIDKEGTPSTQLGPKMGMEPTSLSRTLKSMEDDKLIRREIDTDDKRKVLIFLTPKGIEKRRIVRDVVLDFDDRLISRIPKTKLKAYFDVMDIIDGFIDKELKVMNE
ncbi:MAG: regulatory protein MarR [Crocinitomicaceae bacterium]|jgi:DNA-binding MarR family transcriptional regulator|nr:regulatory protein MarR [Crocinitomicaceae bacterium]